MKVANISSLGIKAATEWGIRYVGRPSPLGNPCSRPNVPCPICGEVHFGSFMRQLTECRSIPCYRKWLWRKLRDRDPAVVAALESLREHDTLGCFCAPKACHADVIIAAWQWLQQREESP